MRLISKDILSSLSETTRTAAKSDYLWKGGESMALVQVNDGESIESALRRFKRRVQSEDIIRDAKKHTFYLKPGEKKRIKSALARKRNRKRTRTSG